MKCFLPLILLILAWLSAGIASAQMQLQSYDPAKYDRFYAGDDKAFIGDDYDWSGVGRDDAGTNGHWAVMISPSYFLSATHYHSGTGSTLYFYYSNDPTSPDGYETRTVSSDYAQIGSTDLWLGRLSEPVSSQVAIYPVLSLSELSDFNDLELYVFGRSNTSTLQTNVRLGRNNIDSDSYVFEDDDSLDSQGWIYTFDYDTVGGQGADECFLQPYDSGGSSFVIANGEPALVGIHWLIGTDDETGQKYSGDSFVSYYIDEINAAMTGEQLTIVPEPGAWTMLLAAASLLLFRGRIKRV